MRFGEGRDVLAAGEGIETCSRFSRSSRRCPWRPDCPPRTCRHPVPAGPAPPLYILRDNDAAGGYAVEARRNAPGKRHRVPVLKPSAKDLNVDLRAGPAPAVKGRLIAQLEPEDRCRFGFL